MVEEIAFFRRFKSFSIRQKDTDKKNEFWYILLNEREEYGYAGLAQLVEQLFRKQRVRSSILLFGSKKT